MKHPISEQLGRGEELFGAALAEVPVVRPGQRLQAKPLPMDESWGPFKHIGLEAEFGMDADRENGVFDLFPNVNILMYLDPGVNFFTGTFKVAAHYRPLKRLRPNTLTDKQKLKPGKLLLRPSYVGFDIESSGHDRIQPLTGQENEENGPLVAEILRRGIDVLEALGSTGLKENLSPWLPRPSEEYKSIKDFMAVDT